MALQFGAAVGAESLSAQHCTDRNSVFLILEHLSATIYQEFSPEHQIPFGIAAFGCQGFQSAIWVESPMVVMVAPCLTRVNKAMPLFIFLFVGPGIPFVAVAFGARPVQIGIDGFQVRATMRAMKGMVMVYLTSCFTTEEEFLCQAVGASKLEVLTQEIAILPVVSVLAFGDAAGQLPPDKSRGLRPSARPCLQAVRFWVADAPPASLGNKKCQTVSP